MDDLDAFLNTSFDAIPGFDKSRRFEKQGPRDSVHIRRRDRGYNIIPDRDGNIFEICGLCHVTLDFCGTFEEAKELCEQSFHAWNFYQIWQINVASQKKVLVSQISRYGSGNNLRNTLSQLLKKEERAE